MHNADSRAPNGPGYLPLQDFGFKEKGLEAHARSCLIAWRLLGRHERIPTWKHDVESVGDVTGGQLFKAPSRLIPAWRFSPMPVVIAPDEGLPYYDPVTNLGGATTPGGGPISTRTPSDSVTTPGGPVISPRGDEYDPSGIGEIEQDSREPTDAARDPYASPADGGSLGYTALPPERAEQQTYAAVPAPMVPVRGESWLADERFDAIPPTRPRSRVGRSWPIFPRGTYGVTVVGTEEDAQFDQFHPTDPRIIAAHRHGTPSNSSLIADVTSDGSIDELRVAPFHTAFRVVVKPSGMFSFQGPGDNVLALQLGRTGLRDAVGGLVQDGKDGLGAMSSRHGGAWHIGGKKCKHYVGQDADGNPIRPVHTHCGSFFIDKWGDGPLHFEKGEYPKTTEGPIPIAVHLVFDGSEPYHWPPDAGSGNEDHGKWKWFASGFVYGGGGGDEPPTGGGPPVTTGGGEPGGPTTGGGGGGEPPGDGPGGEPGGGGGDGLPPYDPSTGGVTTPRGDEYTGPPVGGGTGPGGGDRAPPGPVMLGDTSSKLQAKFRAYSLTELVVPSIVGRAQRYEAGEKDLAHAKNVTPAEKEKHDKEGPATVRIVAYAAQAGSPFAYTQKPGESTHLGGTANGGLAIMPPEVDPLDAAADFELGSPPQSTTYIIATPGVRVAFGVPDLSSGAAKKAISVGVDSAGTVTIRAHDATGAETDVLMIEEGVVRIADGVDVALGSGVGTKIGTDDSEKLGFHGATPTIQSAGWDASGSTPTKTFDVGLSSDTDLRNFVSTLVLELRSKGLLGV